MKLAITFYITNYSLMKEHWDENSILKDKNIFGTNVPLGIKKELGGKIVIFDWDRKQEIKSKELSCPSGFDVKGDKLFVCSMSENKIFVLNNDLEIIGGIGNQYFNDLHSLHSTKKGFILANTGLDCIIEVNDNGKILWIWWANENGFNRDMFGKNRIIEIGIDHREIDYPTLAQTTHLNSVIYVDEDENKSYVVLFHQGQVIEIDKKTLKVRTILSGLDHPHSVYKLSENFLVSDTNKNRILIFDNNGKILKSITGEFDWIQDAIKLSNGNYLIADSNNFRLVEVDDFGRIINSYYYNKNYKIYQVKEIVDS